MEKTSKSFALMLAAVMLLCVALPTGLVSPVFAETTQGLVAYYKFDGDLKDYSGSNNNGTAASGNITYAKAVAGNGAKFDGASYIQVADSDSLDFNSAFTVSVWLYKDGAGSNQFAPVLSKGDNTFGDENTPFAIRHNWDGYKPAVRLINTDGYEELECTTQVSMQKWSMITTVFNGSEVLFYIDGVFKNKVSWDYGDLFSSSQKLLIGCDPVDETRLFKGMMDELRLYNRALSESEINGLYTFAKNQAAAPAPTAAAPAPAGTPDGTAPAPQNTAAAPAGALPAIPGQIIMPAYVDTVAKTGLVAHYKFDGDLTDASGTGNNGAAAQGAIEYAGSVLGKGAKFNGSTYVAVPDSDSLDLNKNFTVSVWLYKDGAGPKQFAPVLSKGDNSFGDENTPFALRHNWDGYKPAVRLINTDGYQELECTTEVSMQKWHMVTVQFNGTELKFYIDGIFKNSVSWDYGELFSSDQKLLIGCDPVEETKLFKGIMDDLRIYNRLLSDAEIGSLYSDVMKTREMGGKLVAHYRFDNGLWDYSGFNNHGTAAAGNITYVKGIYGNGAFFNGSSYIQVPDSDSLDMSKAFTISAWINKDSAGPKQFAPIVSKGDNTFGDENTPFTLMHSWDGYKPALRLINRGGHQINECTTEVSMKKWYHLTATFNAELKEIKFYIDGVFQNKVTWDSGELFHSPQKLLIGCDPVDESKLFSGIIDDLRIYNYTMTDLQAKYIYEMSKAADALWATYKLEVTPYTPNAPITLKAATMLKPKMEAVSPKGVRLDAFSFVNVASSNPAVIKYEGGLLKPVAPGTAEITFSAGSQVIKQVINVVQ